MRKLATLALVLAAGGCAGWNRRAAGRASLSSWCESEERCTAADPSR